MNSGKLEKMTRLTAATGTMDSILAKASELALTKTSSVENRRIDRLTAVSTFRTVSLKVFFMARPPGYPEAIIYMRAR